MPWKSRYAKFKDIPFKPRETGDQGIPIWNRWIRVLALTALFCAEGTAPPPDLVNQVPS